MTTHRPVSKVIIAPPGPLGIRIKANPRGLIVLSVDDKSPLLGKVEKDDWIVTMDGEEVSSSSDMTAKKDEGRLLGILTLKDQQCLQMERLKRAVGGTSLQSLLEFTVEPRGATLGLLLDESHVVEQVCPGSPLEGKLWKMDKIYAVNHVSVTSLDQLQLSVYLESLRQDHETIVLKVERDPKRKKNPQKPSPKRTKVASSRLNVSSELLTFLSPDQGKLINLHLGAHSKANNKIFPALAAYGISMGVDSDSQHLRQLLLSELVSWNDKNNVEQIVVYKGGPPENLSTVHHHLSLVPLGQGTKIVLNETPTKEVLAACKLSGLFEQAIHSVTKYFGFSSLEDGLHLWLYYLAHTHSEDYEKSHQVAQKVEWDAETLRKRQETQKRRTLKKREASSLSPDQIEDYLGEEETYHNQQGGNVKRRKQGDEEIALPPDYQDFDGSGDHRWNIRYLDLIQYKQKYGHVMVSTREVPLGKFVAWQRESWRKNYASLTSKRKELLDELGFVWEAKHANRSPHVETGDPRLNKALALKIVYGSQLADQQAFFVAGFSAQEMDQVRNPAHPWRNGLVVLKKRLDARLKTFLARQQSSEQEVIALPRRKTFMAVQELVDALQDALNHQKHDAMERILGSEKAKLLQKYLESNASRDLYLNNNPTVNNHMHEPNPHPKQQEQEQNEGTMPTEPNSSLKSDEEHFSNALGPDMGPALPLEGDSTAAATVGHHPHVSTLQVATNDPYDPVPEQPWNTEPANSHDSADPSQPPFHHNPSPSSQATATQHHPQQHPHDPQPSWRRGYVLPTASYDSGFPY